MEHNHEIVSRIKALALLAGESMLTLMMTKSAGGLASSLSCLGMLRRAFTYLPDEHCTPSLASLREATISALEGAREKADLFAEGLRDNSFMEDPRKVAILIASGEMAWNDAVSVIAFVRPYAWLEALNAIGVDTPNDLQRAMDVLPWLADTPPELRQKARAYAETELATTDAPTGYAREYLEALAEVA